MIGSCHKQLWTRSCMHAYRRMEWLNPIQGIRSKLKAEWPPAMHRDYSARHIYQTYAYWRDWSCKKPNQVGWILMTVPAGNETSCIEYNRDFHVIFESASSDFVIPEKELIQGSRDWIHEWDVVELWVDLTADWSDSRFLNHQWKH